MNTVLLLFFSEDHEGSTLLGCYPDTDEGLKRAKFHAALYAQNFAPGGTWTDTTNFVAHRGKHETLLSLRKIIDTVTVERHRLR